MGAHRPKAVDGSAIASTPRGLTGGDGWRATKRPSGPLGDLDPEVFRRHGHEVVDWIAGFLEAPERYPVLARVKPGDVRGALPTTAPDGPEPLDRVLADFERVILPGHHALEPPGLLRLLRHQRLRARDPRRAPLRRAERQRHALAHVAGRHGAGGGRPRLAAEAPRPARRLPRRHLRHGVHLDALRARGGARGRRARRPGAGDGRALRHPAAPRLHVRAGPQLRREGRDRPRLRARGRSEDPDRRASSGWTRPRSRARSPRTARRAGGPSRCARRSGPPGRRASTRCRRSPTSPRARGSGSTSTPRTAGSRPSCPSGARCWPAAIAPTRSSSTRTSGSSRPSTARRSSAGDPTCCKRAFTLVPSFLQTPEGSAVENYMDWGPQLGRRFRALKLWMVLRAFGRSGIEARLREHMRLGAAVRRVGRRRSGLGADRPRPVQHGRLPAPAPGLGGRRPAAQRAERAAPRGRERLGRGVPVPRGPGRALRAPPRHRQHPDGGAPRAAGVGDPPGRGAPPRRPAGHRRRQRSRRPPRQDALPLDGDVGRARGPDRGTHQALRRLHGGRPRRPPGRGGRALRLPRPERRREVHDAPDALRHPRADRRDRTRARHRPPAGARAHQGRHRLHVAALLALRRPVGGREPRLLRDGLRRAGAAPARAHRPDDPAGRPGRPRGHAGGPAVGRLPPAAGAGLRPRPRAPAHVPRRADGRRRPGVAPHVLGADPAPRRQRRHRAW